MWTTWISLLLLMFGLLLAGTAVAALYWAARNGQFRNMEAGSRVIFDSDEPVGMPTDQIFKPKPSGRKTL